MPTAIEPTPPVAPVTRTGPAPGVSPRSSNDSTDSAAVKPAVPIVIASRRSSPAGHGTSQSDGTRASSAYPPCRDTPRSYPWAITGLPTGNASSSLSRTVPARSMPGIERRDPGDLALGRRRQAVLEVDTRPLDVDQHAVGSGSSSTDIVPTARVTSPSAEVAVNAVNVSAVMTSHVTRSTVPQRRRDARGRVQPPRPILFAVHSRYSR